MVVLGLIAWFGGLYLWMRWWNKKVVEPLDRKLRTGTSQSFGPVLDTFLETEEGRKMARTALLLRQEGKELTAENFHLLFYDAYRRANGVE